MGKGQGDENLESHTKESADRKVKEKQEGMAKQTEKGKETKEALERGEESKGKTAMSPQQKDGKQLHGRSVLVPIKTPGSDGFPVDLFRTFWAKIKIVTVCLTSSDSTGKTSYTSKANSSFFGCACFLNSLDFRRISRALA